MSEVTLTHQPELGRFFDLSLEWMCVFDAKGILLRTNLAFQRALGQPAGALVGQSILDLVHPEDFDTASVELALLEVGVDTINFNCRLRTAFDTYVAQSWWATCDPVSGQVYATARATEASPFTPPSIPPGIDGTALAEGSREAWNARDILRDLPMGILCIDDDTLRITFANPTFLQLVGCSSDQLIGTSPLELQPSQAQTAESSAWQSEDMAALKSGQRQVIRVETTIQHKDGRALPIELHIRHVGSDGGASHFLAVVHDISDRRDAQMERTRAEAVLDTVMDGIVVIDASGIVITYSPGAQRIFGYTAHQVVGHNISMLMPHPHRHNHDGYLANYITTGRARIIGIGRAVEGLRKDGTRIPLHLSVTEMVVEGKRYFTGLLRDISERKRQEAIIEAKTAALERAGRLDRAAADIMTALNQPGASSPSADVLQILAERIGCRPLALFSHDEWQGGLTLEAGVGVAPSLPSFHRLGEGLVGEAARQRKPIFLTESAPSLKLNTGIGTLEPAMVFAVPLVHRSRLMGVLVGASPRLLDENERLWLNQTADQVAVGLSSLQQYKELTELSDQLNQRSLRIEEQNKELARASRMKSEFLASMSHELRTPLNAIIGFSEVLKDGVMGPLQPDHLDYVTEIFGAGRHLLSLINDILDLSKIEAGKMTLDFSTVDLNEFCENAISSLRENATKAGVALSVAPDPAHPLLDIDGRKLRQIVYNLVSNGLKFTDPGGAVLVSVSSTEQQVKIEVADTGIGIAQEDLGLLFRPFEQLQGGLNRRFEGTGLGLTMVKRLVTLMGGRVGVSSKLGTGSRFWVELPRQHPGSEGHALDHGPGIKQRTPGPGGGLPLSRLGEALGAPTSGGAVRVLLVEDDPAAIELTRAWLQPAGYEVQVATHPRPALELIEERMPDAILLDIHFSNGMDGWDLLEALQTRPSFSHIPIVIVSIDATAKRGLVVGAAAVLQKPVTGNQLLAALRDAGVSSRTSGESPRILVVDDDPRAVEHVSRRLEAQGMVVTRALGGKEALHSLRTQAFDAVILDLMMPEVSGFEVASAMRYDLNLSETPIIVLSAMALQDEERAGLEAMAASIMGKGEWSETAFLSAVRHAVSNPSSMPRTQRPATVTSRPSRDQPQPASLHPRGRVLILDGDPPSYTPLRLYLSNAGYQVLEASDTETALSVIDWASPQLVIAGLESPENQGFTVLQRSATDPRLQGVPLLIIAETSGAEQARALGVQAVLPKPVPPDRLVQLAAWLTGGVEHRQVRILIVDDEPHTLSVVASYFHGQDIEVAQALGGSAALSELGSRQLPDLIVLDLMMPEVSGFEILATLQADAQTESIPVIALVATDLSAREMTEFKQQFARVFNRSKTTRESLLQQVHRLLQDGRVPTPQPTAADAQAHEEGPK